MMDDVLQNIGSQFPGAVLASLVWVCAIVIRGLWMEHRRRWRKEHRKKWRKERDSRRREHKLRRQENELKSMAIRMGFSMSQSDDGFRMDSPQSQELLRQRNIGFQLDDAGDNL